MIVILCDSFENAREAYQTFMSFLECNEPFCIRNRYGKCLCVETDDDLRYIFIDHRMASIFKDMNPDYLDVDEFFEGIYISHSEPIIYLTL